MSSKEYYGSLEGMPDDILDTKLLAAKADVENLSREVSRRQEFTAEELLADRLHKLLHFGTDCDFYYSNWPNASGCRAEFRTAADRILSTKQTDFTISILERLRFGK